MIKPNWNFTKKPHFLFTQENEVKNRGRKLIDHVVGKFKAKKFTRCLIAVTFTIIALGNQTSKATG